MVGDHHGHRGQRGGSNRRSRVGVTKRPQPSMASEAKNAMAAEISHGSLVHHAVIAMAEITTR